MIFFDKHPALIVSNNKIISMSSLYGNTTARTDE